MRVLSAKNAIPSRDGWVRINPEQRAVRNRVLQQRAHEVAEAKRAAQVKITLPHVSILNKEYPE